MADGGPAIYESLTERELDILRLIADGRSNREIADNLFLSVNTVRWYNKQIYSKMDVHSRTDVVARADSGQPLHALFPVPHHWPFLLPCR